MTSTERLTRDTSQDDMKKESEPNGCGAQGSFFDPPDLRFNEACNEHDLAYGFGGTARDRASADRAMLRATTAKAKAAPWHKAAYLYPAAYAYYAAVRLFGWRHWGKK